MNPANLQMEGVLLVLAALCDDLRRKGVLDHDEIEAALGRAEGGASRRASDLRESSDEAIRFPIRFLRMALQQNRTDLDYHAVTADVGRQKARLAASGVWPRE